MSEIDPCTAYDAALEEMSVLKAKVAKLEAEKADLLQQARQVSGLLEENGALRADKATLVEALARISKLDRATLAESGREEARAALEKVEK